MKHLPLEQLLPVAEQFHQGPHIAPSGSELNAEHIAGLQRTGDSKHLKDILDPGRQHLVGIGKPQDFHFYLVLNRVSAPRFHPDRT